MIAAAYGDGCASANIVPVAASCQMTAAALLPGFPSLPA